VTRYVATVSKSFLAIRITSLSTLDMRSERSTLRRRLRTVFNRSSASDAVIVHPADSLDREALIVFLQMFAYSVPGFTASRPAGCGEPFEDTLTTTGKRVSSFDSRRGLHGKCARRNDDTLLPRRGSTEVGFVDIGRCRPMNLVLIILLLLLLFGGGGGFYYGGPAVGGGIGGILLIVLIIYLVMGRRG
jgi:hypothetical protein